VDAAILDLLIAEIAPLLVGRALGKARSVAAHAVAFEIAGDRTCRLWLDASRRAAGVFLVNSRESAAIEERGELPGRDRHALLLLRKHAEGRRIVALARVAGSRTLVVDAGRVVLALRLSGTPALTLALDGEAAATLGEGAPAWPLPVERLEAEQRPPAPVSPMLRLPGLWPLCRDRDLAPASAVSFGGDDSADARSTGSWREAAGTYLIARRRGARFDALQQAALKEARREIRRLTRLEANLAEDAAELPEADALRRQAEALLASPQAVPSGVSEAMVPDPYDATRFLTIALDPRLSATANADRVFGKARRIDRARAQLAARLSETRQVLAAARGVSARAEAAEMLADLAAPLVARTGERGASETRHYLTTRGLSILVGRGARENHHLTFSVARSEDLWLHARDVPGSHVIVRDNEGRAAAEDMREAAELAAFFSDARQEGRVDVHVTRRKHVRPAKGGPGRVHVFHSDTIRVTPRDPEGRLRRR
jgi:hypothetical protein